MTNHHTHTLIKLKRHYGMYVLYVHCWNTVKVWKITKQHTINKKLSSSLSCSLPPEPEPDINNGRISGKLVPDIQCIPNFCGCYCCGNWMWWTWLAAPLLGSIEFSLLYSAVDCTLECVILRAKVHFFFLSSIYLLIFTRLCSVLQQSNVMLIVAPVWRIHLCSPVSMCRKIKRVH